MSEDTLPTLDLTDFPFNKSSKFKDRLDLVASMFYKRRTHKSIADEVGIDRSAVTQLSIRLNKWVDAHPEKDSLFRDARGSKKLHSSSGGALSETFDGDIQEFKDSSKKMIETITEMVNTIDVLSTDKRKPQWYDVKLRSMKLLKDFMDDYWERFGYLAEKDDDKDEHYELLKQRVEGFMGFLEEHAPQLCEGYIDYLDGDVESVEEEAERQDKEREESKSTEKGTVQAKG